MSLPPHVAKGGVGEGVCDDARRRWRPSEDFLHRRKKSTRHKGPNWKGVFRLQQYNTNPRKKRQFGIWGEGFKRHPNRTLARRQRPTITSLSQNQCVFFTKSTHPKYTYFREYEGWRHVSFGSISREQNKTQSCFVVRALNLNKISL